MEKLKLKNNKLGAFIVPTGVGASIGGYAGDASFWAREFAKESTLIVNPNVVNAGGFSGITPEMLYVEGYSLDEFFKGKLSLIPSLKNKIGVVFDKGISQGILNVHINTINAVKTVYGVEVIGYEISEKDAGVEFFIDESNISMGRVKDVQTLIDAGKKLLEKGADAIAVVCKFSDEEQNEDYSSGVGVDPIGGVEAIISHCFSKELVVPAAHSPAFEDITISQEIVNPKASSEYITPTFLPCILLGLDIAPKLSKNINEGINIENLDYLVMPCDSLGSVPVFESLKRGIRVFAVAENSTVLNVGVENLFENSNIIQVETYQECLELVKKL